jgi:hypothetical protein
MGRSTSQQQRQWHDQSPITRWGDSTGTHASLRSSNALSMQRLMQACRSHGRDACYARSLFSKSPKAFRSCPALQRRWKGRCSRHRSPSPPQMSAAPSSRQQASLDSHGAHGAKVVAAAADRCNPCTLCTCPPVVYHCRWQNFPARAVSSIIVASPVSQHSASRAIATLLAGIKMRSWTCCARTSHVPEAQFWKWPQVGGNSTAQHNIAPHSMPTKWDAVLATRGTCLFAVYLSRAAHSRTIGTPCSRPRRLMLNACAEICLT